MRLFSPAKINLFLRVLRKREDGFHDLASLFQAIDLGDTLTFTLSDSDQLTCSDPFLPLDKNNLVLKALDLFRQKTGLSFSVNIHLEKRIPIQSGLGGGSSNAATTLWGLNQLTGCPATSEELKNWSSLIGSDIPFFFSSGTAYCTGKGEQVRSLLPLKQPGPLWIAKPTDGLSTPLIFKTLKLNQCSKLSGEDCLNRWLSGHPLYLNDLETPAFTVLPTLRELKEDLKKQVSESVMMTGSGTGFFCFGNKPVMKNVALFSAHFVQRTEHEWY